MPYHVFHLLYRLELVLMLQHPQCMLATGGESFAQGIVGRHLQQRGTSLSAELRKASPLAAACAVKGLVASLSPAALCTPMRLDDATVPGEMTTWQPITHGALPKACQAMEQAADASFKYHALQLLTACLQRTRKLLQVWLAAVLSVLVVCRIELTAG